MAVEILATSTADALRLDCLTVVWVIHNSDPNDLAYLAVSGRGEGYNKLTCVPRLSRVESSSGFSDVTFPTSRYSATSLQGRRQWRFMKNDNCCSMSSVFAVFIAL